MIIIGGMPGSGKTRYTRVLSESLASQAFYETGLSNPVLDNYYQDPIRYGLASQVYFLCTRFKSLKEAATYPRNIVTRSIYEDLLFAQVNYELKRMNEEEKMVYDTLATEFTDVYEHQIMNNQKTLFVYLRSSFEQIIRNLDVPFQDDQHRLDVIEYYRALHLRYEKWMREYYNDSQFLTIDVDKFNLGKREDLESVITLVHTHIEALGI